MDLDHSMGMPMCKRQNCLSTGPKNTIQYIINSTETGNADLGDRNKGTHKIKSTERGSRKQK